MANKSMSELRFKIPASQLMELDALALETGYRDRTSLLREMINQTLENRKIDQSKLKSILAGFTADQHELVTSINEVKELTGRTADVIAEIYDVQGEN